MHQIRASRLIFPMSNRLDTITVFRSFVQENEEATTMRIPIVLAGATCEGSEQNLGDCPNFSLGRRVIPDTCIHAADVYLVCNNGADPGMLF